MTDSALLLPDLYLWSDFPALLALFMPLSHFLLLLQHFFFNQIAVFCGCPTFLYCVIEGQCSDAQKTWTRWKCASPLIPSLWFRFLFSLGARVASLLQLCPKSNKSVQTSWPQVYFRLLPQLSKIICNTYVYMFYVHIYYSMSNICYSPFFRILRMT